MRDADEDEEPWGWAVRETELFASYRPHSKCSSESSDGQDSSTFSLHPCVMLSFDGSDPVDVDDGVGLNTPP
jgi:hypothetical protein